MGDENTVCFCSINPIQSSIVYTITKGFGSEPAPIDNIYVIYCPTEFKKYAIMVAKEIAHSFDLREVFWVDDSYNLNRMDETYLALCSFKTNRKRSILKYTDRSKQPPEVKNYINALEKYLGVQIVELLDGKTGCLVFRIKAIDNTDYVEKLRIFISEFGVGPFGDIKILGNGGNILEDNINHKGKNRAKKQENMS